ncbi:polysaccharide pyruvyl transferase family protein [Aureimonas leprariae]|uniref:Exopolysaccharide biosynthesis protein n=1 Tax=Plantimonas leprariae TaxID=2615207 RepID=A0A7V7PLW7_9HYPH|nr:polysaccharide pyruvyl transferase family protein [Aureimonas leprariae]KAB0677697.1 exopolysaccharide biosynthesis protein [Aureimonas leprariae]
MKHLGEAVIEAQRSLILSVVEKHVGKGQSYVLMDFPNYQNIGDSAIWLGMAKALRQVTGKLPSWVGYTPRDVEIVRERYPGQPVFICGGGNFGDVWRGKDDLRYRLLEALPDQRIVQMPQAIQFRDPEFIEYAKRLIGAHKDFHLLVRDHRSLDFAKTNFDCSVGLAPDTAFFIGKIEPLPTERVETLYLLRDDREAGIEIPEAKKAVPGPVRDWMDCPTTVTRKSASSVLKAVAHGDFSSAAWRSQHYEDVANRRVQYGVKLLSAGKRIVTNRLHIHIVSTLMNIPHVALDNNYGKIHGYIDAWTAASPLVRKAKNDQEVLTGLSELPYVANGDWRNAA